MHVPARLDYRRFAQVQRRVGCIQRKALVPAILPASCFPQGTPPRHDPKKSPRKLSPSERRAKSHVCNLELSHFL